MEKSMIPIRVCTTEDNRIAHEYYIINKDILIPKLGNAQEVLETYIANFHQLHLPQYIEEYPTCTMKQKDNIFRNWLVLSVKIKYIPDEKRIPSKVHKVKSTPSITVLNNPFD